jgi:hypothetical protein
MSSSRSHWSTPSAPLEVCEALAAAADAEPYSHFIIDELGNVIDWRHMREVLEQRLRSGSSEGG